MPLEFEYLHASALDLAQFKALVIEYYSYPARSPADG